MSTEFERLKREALKAVDAVPPKGNAPTVDSTKEKTISGPQTVQARREQEWIPPILTARINKKSEFAGMGCFLQLLGIILFFCLIGFFPVGTILGIVVLIAFFSAGSAMSKKLSCSHCGNRISDKGVKICPTCKAEIIK